jgi:hypothetical protein
MWAGCVSAFRPNRLSYSGNVAAGRTQQPAGRLEDPTAGQGRNDTTLYRPLTIGNRKHLLVIPKM